MEHILEELTKRDDFPLILFLVVAVILALIVFWVMRILFVIVKNWVSSSDDQTETIKELAVNNTQINQQISQQLNQSSQSLSDAASKLTHISTEQSNIAIRQESIEKRQEELEKIAASITSILDRMEKSTREADEAVRTEINEHETRAIQRSNENLEVSRDILQVLSDAKVKTIPEHLKNIGTQNDTIIASLDTVRKGQIQDKEHLKKIEQSVFDAVKDGKDRDSMISQVLSMLNSLEDRLKVLQTKPLEVAAVYSKPSGGDAA